MSWSIIWFDANGQMIDLCDPPFVTTRWQSLKGASVPEYRAVTERVPLKDGSNLKYIDVDETEIDLTLIVRGTDEEDLWNRLALLSNSFNPRINSERTGVLRVTPPNGITREIECYPISGFRINESTLAPTTVDVELTFLATYPFWRSVNEVVETFALDNPPNWFPIFPLQLGGDAIVSVFQLDNFGHVPVFPIWKITGPGSNPKITKQTTGEYIALTNNGGITLDSGQFITVDAQAKKITLNDGTNLMSKLDWGSSFFSIPANGVFEEGVSIKAEMPGATTESSIEVRYRTYYQGVV